MQNRHIIKSYCINIIHISGKGVVFMGNYFNNQDKWWFTIVDDHIRVTTDHGTHFHTLNLDNVTCGDMRDHSDRTMGDAHRAARHEWKKTKL